MRFFLTLTTLTIVAAKHDYVAFTFDESVNQRLSNLNLQDEIDSATPASPLVLLFVDRFTLPDFSTFVNAYSQSVDGLASSNISETMRSSKGYDAGVLHRDEITLSPNAVQYHNGDAVDGTKSILYALSQSLKSADVKLTALRAHLHAPYTVVIISNDALDDERHQSAVEHTRRKRAAEGDCKISIGDGLTVSKHGGGDHLRVCMTKAGDITKKCTDTTASFTMKFDNPNHCGISEKGGIGITDITLTYTFNKTSKNFWSLASGTIDAVTTASGNPWKLTKGELMGKDSIYVADIAGRGYQCAAWPALHKKQEKGDTIDVAFQLNTTRVAPFGDKDGYTDCIGYFTQGSLMALMTALILVLSLIAGVSMLHELKSSDRFDDPKAPQLQINTKGGD